MTEPRDIAGLSPEQRALLMMRLRRKAAQEETPGAAAIPRVPREGPLPLSFAQQRLWFLDRWAPESPAYNVPAAVFLDGDLDTRALAGALGVIVQRHETLRTTFPAVDGEPRQVIAPPAPLPVPLIDLTALPGTAGEAEGRRLVRLEARRSFDLGRGPLLRVRLLRLGGREHLLLVNLHHIVSDGWSVGVLIRELSELYAALRDGRPPALPPLPVQYADFAVWQRRRLEGEELERQLAYWRERLGDPPPPLELPTDRPRPASRTFEGRLRPFVFPEGLWPAIEAFCQRQGMTTPFMVLLAGFAALLHRLTGQDEMALGTPIANRNRQEIEGLIGFFVNLLVLRGDLTDDPTFGALLARVREETLGAYSHQDLPFEKLVEELQPERRLDAAPLFQVTFSLQNAPVDRLNLPGLELRALPAETGAARFDLGLDVLQFQQTLGRWEYAAELFDAPTLDRMSGHFLNLLAAATADPGLRISELPLLTPPERHQLLTAWNDTAAIYEKDLTIHELLELQAERRPDAVAIVSAGSDNEQLTYAGLIRESRGLARHLRDLGVGPESIVGVSAERSLRLPVALLGILQAGGAYLPLDPDYPEARRALMLEEAGVRVVLDSTEGKTPGGGASPPGRWAVGSGGGQEGGFSSSPDSLAYVLYTSGSTGRPKGVAIPHRGVLRLTRGGGHARLDEGEVVLQIAPASFDASTLEIWGALLNGGRLVMMPPGRPTLDGLADALVRHGVTTLLLTSGLFHAVVDERLDALAGLRQIVAGGDVVSPGHVRRALAALPGCDVWACYGPTEVTTFTACHPAWKGPLERTVPIGRPIADTQVYILDRRLSPVPVGVVGELAAGGAALARGYLGRPDLTAERFVPDAGGQEPGGRLYLTGDLVRALPDGTLEFLGRVDAQVKLRGFRVEPQEVEAVLLAHPAVAQAAVLVLGETESARRLVAYVQAEGGDGAREDLRDWLRERMPDFMVPATVVGVPEMPLTPNGKVDRRALAALAVAAPDGERGEAETPFVPLRGPVEEVLGGIWAEVLGRQRIGARDGFFDLGGHSLLAIRVLSRVRQAFGVELPLRALFEEPTLSGLARRVERALDGSPPPPRIEPVPRDRELPLSFAQQRLWFIDQLEPDSAVYNTPFFLRLTGGLDVPALAAAFAGAVERHEVLRTTFAATEGSAAVQVLGPPFAPELPVVDLGGLSAESRDAEARRLATLEAGRPFDLRRGPILRISLLRLAAAEHVLLLNAHHIATDAWSMEVLWREVSMLYAACRQGRPAVLPPLPIQYADFAVWQRGWLQGEVLETQLDYWRSRLGGELPVVELPADRPRPAVQSYRGADLPLALPADASAALLALSRREGATPFMTLLALFVALLGRMTGQRDLPVGTPISGRRQPEVEGLVGFFLNTLVIRAGLPEGATFRALVGQVRALALEAYAHQDVPFEKLVDELSPRRSLSHSPLFQVLFVLLHQERGTDSPEGLAAGPFPVERGTSKFDLMLALYTGGDAIAGTLEYATDLFDRPTIARLAEHLGTLASAVTAAPDRDLSELALLAGGARHQLLAEWNDTARPLPEPSLHQLFERQAERTPDAAAAVFGDHSLTYGELARRAARLARQLRRLGIGPESLVGLGLDRSLEMVTGVLGVLTAGAAYVPLDPALPRERRAYMLESSGAEVLLTRSGLLAEMSHEGVRTVCLDGPALDGPGIPPGGPLPDPGNLAYVIYTSGSTGRPKGVALPRLALSNLIDWHLRHFLGGVRTLQFASLSFDVSFLEMFACWASGGTLVLLSEELRRDVPALAGSLVEAGVEKAVFPVVVLQRLAEEYAGRGFQPLPPLAEITTMGEQLQTSRVMGDLLRSLGGCSFHNHYGPSESHVVTAFALDPDPAAWATHPSIGLPIANSRVHLLDEGLEPVPVGVPGELVIGGVCLARGYAGRPDLTAEKFIPDPFAGGGGEPGARLYRTGDKVRRLPDGNLDFLGRFDHQVKVRGFRVEPEEVESVLGGCPGVRQTVVLVRRTASGGPGDTRLVAYVVPEPGAGSPGTWRAFLRERLPDYMVPSHFVELEAFPLNANGKVDRRALPAPEEGARPDLAAAYLAPRTPIEETLAAIWSDVLGIERVGVEDDFFELGGQSLLATQAVSRVRQAMGVEVPLRALFEGPTVAELARVVEAARGALALTGPEAPPLVPMPAALRAGELPLSFAQQRLWFLDRLVPDNPFYNMFGAVRLAGPVDVPALREACREIARRHEVLRTTFPAVAGRPVQALSPEPPPGFPLIDLAGLPQGGRREELERLALAEGRRPFDLTRGPIFRTALLRLGETEHSLFFNIHHIASDGWSLGVLHRDLAALYGAFHRRLPSPLPELPIQYADFAVWQRGWLQGEALRVRLDYWKRQLDGMPEVLELPYDRPRPAVETFRGAGAAFPLPAPLVRGLSLLARRQGATLSMVVLAGFKALLARLSGRGDVPVGVAIAGRNRRETEELIGFFVNTLVLRTLVSGSAGAAGFGELVARVRETSLGAYAHQDLPFEKLVEELAPDRDLGRNPLVQVTFGFHNFPRREVETGGLVLIPPAEEAVSTGTSKFDLSLHLFESGGGLQGSLEYNLDLFDEPTARRFTGHLATLLAAAVEDPAVPPALLPLLSEAESHQLLIGWNDTAAAYERDLTVSEVFALQVAARPDAVAVIAGDEHLTYLGVARDARRLAAHLRDQGVGPEEIVGLHAERSATLPAAMLGILQAGAAYLPLDPEAPEERLALMRDEAGVRIVVSPGVVVPPPLGGWEVGSGGGQEGGSSSSLAYVIYTSGSTGRPKGVAVPHRGIVRLVRQAGYARLDPAETLLQVAPVSFDASTFEIWGALLNGGRLVMMPPEKPTLDGIGDALARHGVTTLHLTAGLFHAMVEERLGVLAGLRQLLTGGDVLSAPHVRRAAASLPGCAVLACYGPTEGTTFTSVHRVEPEGAGPLETSVPLGRPIGNTRVLVLDRSLVPVPAGVAGDLAVGGDGLARGYLGRPDLTAERFVPDPWGSGERLYLTGDRVRYRADGTLEFLGRFDTQVKIRGFRVEPAEVEAHLAAHPAVRASAVLAHAEERGDRRLVAYVVPDPAYAASGGDAGSDSGEAAAAGQVAAWTRIFDDTYRAEVPDATFNTVGWVSTATGLPLSREEMGEWVADAVDRILALAPRRVLEIGCGTGLLLFPLAPRCEEYTGTDISPRVLASLAKNLGDLASRVRLLERPADRFDGLGEGSLDLVILNSVVQYFPSADYLASVLERAVAAVRPGGAVFLGDVRSLPLLDAFYASVELAQAEVGEVGEPGCPASRVRRRAETRRLQENELVVDPAFFAELARRLPRIGRVEIHPKRGRAHNELTAFRYQVVLRVGEVPPPPDLPWLDGREGMTLASLRRLLTEARTGPLGIRHLPNARSAAQGVAAALLVQEESLDAADLLARAGEAARGALDPQDVWELGRELGWEVELGWADPGAEGRFEAVFRRPSPSGEPVSRLLPAPPAPPDSRPWSAYATDPLRGQLARRLAPELRAFLAARLPDYMLPAAFVPLDALPLTPNGKLDRKALARLGVAVDPARTGAAHFAAPRTPTEERLAGIWADLLKVPRVGAGDDFFELGGHSLLATQAVSRVRDAFDVELPLRALFEASTVAALAAVIDGARRTGLELALPSSALVQEIQEPPAAPPLPPIVRAPRTGDLPLSFAQQRLWFLDRLVPDNPFYNMFGAVRLAGPIDVAALRAACREIARRHEVLRTTFPEVGGQPVQAIDPESPAELPLIDLGGLPDDARAGEVERLAVAESRRPFDLALGPVFRAALLRLGEAEHSLFSNLHHIACDGWSIRVLHREVAVLYAAFAQGKPSPLPELPVQYADFAVWQRGWLQGETLAAQLGYWQRRLAGMPEVLDLPGDRPRPAVESFRGGVEVFTVPAPLVRRFALIARERGATLSMALLAGFKTLLARLSGQQDVAVGVAIANRTRREIEDLIGFFVNTLVLRTHVSGSAGEGSFGALVSRVRETSLGAYAHQDVPFEKLVEELAPQRHLGRNPLVQVTFGFHNFPPLEIEAGGLLLARSTEDEVDTGTSKFDLSLHLHEAGEALAGVLEYNLDLFDPVTAARFVARLETLLAAAAADPGMSPLLLPLLTEAEHHQLLIGWNDTAAAYERDLTVHEVFDLQVAARPDAVAIVAGDEHLTYLGLAREARRLASHLRAQGVGPEEIVGLHAERSATLPAAMLGILQAGAAYLPLDPEAPEERLALMREEAGVRVVVSRGEVVPPPLGGWEVGSGGGQEGGFSSNLAYVIYTSGSTGRPKGVAVPHRGVVRLVRQAGYARLDPAETLLQVAPVSFDASTFEIWGALLNGGRLVMMPPEKPTLDGIGDALARHGVTTLHLTAGLFHAMVEERLGVLAGLRQLLTGGDVLSAPHVRRAAASLPGCEVLACYGPTEGTTFTSIHPAAAGHLETSVPLGRPIGNTRVLVLDRSLVPVPVSVAGDLAVGGDGLARGYLGRPDLTAERFVPDPWGTGERLYLTGDRVRHLADGTLEFLGRFDTQVKVRGFRVEPAEIEAHLAAHPAVRASAVLAEQDERGDRRLVAYVVPDPEHATAGGNSGGDSGSDSGEAAAAGQVDAWTRIFDDTYLGEAADATFNTVGWVSSATGLPLSREEMGEWVADAVDRISSLAPRRVLEIGCGTGLLLFPLAPHCEQYTGTDISPRVLAAVAENLGDLAARVRLLERPADRFDGLGEDALDLVILNSVVQYFPSADYLATVLERAAAAVRPGGAIFLGDLRSLPLLDAFYVAVELARAEAGAPPSRLRRRAETRRLQENELAVDPAFFAELARRLPKIGRVEVHPKRGRAHNELTAFRYQVVLRIGEVPPPPAVPWRDWRDGLTFETLRRLLAEPAADLLAVRGIPNARCAAHAAAAALLAGEEVSELADLVARAGEAARGAVDPQDLWELGAELGWEVELGWADPGAEGSFEAVFRRPSSAAEPVSRLLPAPPAPPESRPWSSYTTQPLRGQLARRLAPELRAFLAARLPDYMLPAAFVPLDALPLTPNGKLDRRALARLGVAADLAQATDRYAVPRTPTEERLAGIWRDLLKVPRVGAEDDFFALGGHSLLATQAVSRVRDGFGIELPLRALFETPTVAGLAAVIDRAAFGERGPAAPPLVPVPRDRPLPLSYAQERLWFLDRFGTRVGAYNESSAFRLTGRLDVAALRWAMDEIVRRHEVLRTTFGELDGRPVQRIAPTGALDLHLVDLSLLPPSLFETRRLAADLALRPFDLARGPLLRGLLVRLGAEDHAVLLALHHVISDGWSIGVFLRELSALYTARLEGAPDPLPPLPVQYADFAVWQRGWLQGEVLARQIGYWRDTLTGLTPLELPTDRPRPATPGIRGGVVAFSLGEELTRALRDLGRRRGATLFMILLAAFQTLLQRYSGQDDLAVGIPLAGRNRGEIEGLIGFFINMLVLRGDLSGDPGFRALVDRTREAALGAFAHQDVPFEKVVEELQPDRDLGRNPLFQVGFQVANAPAGGLDLPGLALAPVASADPAAKVDLNLSFTEGEEEATGLLGYDADLFERTTALRLGAHLRRLLEGALADPERPLSTLPLLLPWEEQQLLTEWNDAAMAEGETPFLERFADWTRQTPDAMALIFEDEQLTYGELAGRADHLAAVLRGLGVGPEVLVGLCLDASVEILVAILAVWKAGGAYLPLDPSYPPDRLAFMLEDSGAALVLTEERLRASLPDREGVRIVRLDHLEGGGASPPGRGEVGSGGGQEGGSLSRDSLAYVIYTSGSTGRPKGVEVSRRGLGNLAAWHVRDAGVGPGSRVLQVASFSFDASVAKILGAFGTGAALVQARRESWQPGPDLARGLARTEVSFAVMVPPLLSAFPAEAAAQLRALSFLATAGEACPAELVERWAPGRRFWNLYGPTEMTVVCLGGAAQLTGKSPDMGRPLPNCRAHVVDRHFRPVPVGVAGELLLQGVGLARGYLGRPELTAERFVPDPWAGLWDEPGARLYRTGDLARRRADGRLDFLGRIDQQVKIRGFRIELGEVEAVLLEHPEVGEAAVTVRPGSAGDRRLVAFVVPRGATEPDRLVREVGDHLRRRLPDHMVPSAVTLLDRLPLNPNGKLDRKALDRIAVEEGSGARGFVPPRTPVEQALAGIWAEVLKIGQVGVEDDFFALSGNSLLAAQVASRVRQALGVDLPLRRLFERATLGELAREIEEARGSRLPDGETPLPPLERQPRGRPLPASLYQEFGWKLQGGPVGALLNMPLALRARGPLDPGALLASLAEIVRRHEELRSVFLEIDGELFLEAGPVSRVPLPVIDLSALPEERREEIARRLAAEEAVRPFDLSRAPGFRAQVVRLDPCDHALLVTMHHLISDGASFAVFRRELWTLTGAFSRGLPSPLPELPLQPGDFAWWQRRLATAAIAAQVEWWKRRLAGRPPALALPGDRPRPAVVGPKPLTDHVLLPPELVRGLRALTEASGCTVGMVLTAVIQVLLHRYTGEEDVVVGTAFAGRTRPELTGLISLFLNTLPVRADLSGAPAFRDLLLQVREAVLEAYAHQDAPFPRLLAELFPGQAPDRRLLFRVILNVLDFDFAGGPPVAESGPGGLTVETMTRTEVWARYDLALDIQGGEDFLLCHLLAAADILTPEGLAAVKQDLLTLLEQVVADPATPLDRLLPEPRHRPA